MIDYILNHKNYSEYKDYLLHWKEELNECSEDRAKKISNMFGLTCIGYGDRRLCLYKDGKVLKLPLESCHYESNDNEVYLYNYIKENHINYLPYLCPILEYKDGIIVTPFCEEFSDDLTDDDLLDICEKYKNLFNEIGIKFTDLDGPQQLKVLENHIVILDYEDYEISENNYCKVMKSF